MGRGSGETDPADHYRGGDRDRHELRELGAAGALAIEDRGAHRAREAGATTALLRKKKRRRWTPALARIRTTLNHPVADMRDAIIPEVRHSRRRRVLVGQLVPRPSAGWLPDPKLLDRIRRRVKLHDDAELKLVATMWGREILPYLRFHWAAFWEFAIDDALGKMSASEAKRKLRLKGTILQSLRRHARDSREPLAAFQQMTDILKSLRRSGRPGRAEFHDMIAFAYTITRGTQREERTARLELLRRFLELPELGYILRPRDVAKIGYRVIRRVRSGTAAGTYPHTAFLWSAASQRIACGARES